MQTTSHNFHLMRGHVSDGCIIVSPSGKQFTLKNTMSGWMVFGPDDKPISGNLKSAYDVEFFVVNGLQNS